MIDQVLKAEDTDRLAQAVITLTKELWVLKDRQRILEATLQDAGVLDNAAIETYDPDTTLSETLMAERRQLIDSVLDTLITPPLNAPHR
ncbi:MAG: hypothetical protein QGH93_09805 [Gammaproteobacteria bacterium]|jgi:hypothetical protein|nr:hypothetical protein [Chromatiales bacterium]MDP6675122.1 hypothetical protein [Gammaproteobacteria bacterium]